MRRSCTRPGFSLMELMIVILLISVFLTAINYFLRSIVRWERTSYAQNELAEDIARVWTELGADFNVSTWYTGGVTSPLPATFVDDRAAFYVPFVTQPDVPIAAPGDVNLAIFSRIGDYAAPYRIDQATWAFSGLARQRDIDAVMPGALADAALAPSGAFSEGTTYENSYFARSQEIIFVRCLLGSLNSTTGAPLDVAGIPPSQMQRPAELFRAPTPAQRSSGFPNISAWWQQPNNEAALGVFYPSPYIRNPVTDTWSLRSDPVTSAPLPDAYGVVMDGAYLNISQGVARIEPLLEQHGNPSRTAQAVADVRFLGYQVVRSPVGFGRLVRTYVVVNPAIAPAPGVDPGQSIANDPALNSYLVVDKVLSDHVVRVRFETARHDALLGVNGIRATIFFARLGERPGEGNTLILRQSVTMIFTMRGANTAADQVNWSAVVRPSSGPVPFTYP